MDRSSASDASPRSSGSVATLTGLSAATGFPSGPGPHSLFARPTTRSANGWARRPSAPSPPSARRRHVSFNDPEGILGSLRINNSHFASYPHESPSASLPEEVARAPSVADLMPDTPVRRTRKRKTSDPSPEASSMLPPSVAGASTAASADTYANSPPARRASARPRRSPVDADDRVSETRSLKRKASPDPKTPPSKKRAPGRLKADPDEDVNAEHDSTCCICMTEPEPADLASINGCDHMFCFGCIEKWADRENTCPLCKQRFTKIDRVNKTKKKAAKSSKKVKDRSQRSEMTHSLALEGLFGELGRSGIAIESIFSRLGGSRFNTHIARIVVNGIGGSSLFEVGPPPRPFASPRSNAAAGPFAPPRSNAAAAGVPEVAGMPRIEDVFFGSDDDDEDLGYDGFVASIRNMGSIRGGPTLLGSYRGRSFATNMHDADAGETADNALEIADSDDEVEIVRVSPGNW